MTIRTYLIACVGGGSNAAGTIYHYIDDERVRIVLAEAGGKGIETGMTAATNPTRKNWGCIIGARNVVIQNEDGQIEEPYSISAGLDYPGIGRCTPTWQTKNGQWYWLSMMTKQSMPLMN